MELEQIKTLLERYFEGNTTLAEEQHLKNYFLSNRISPELEEYKVYFGYLSNTGKERSQRGIVLKRKSRWLSIAASILILIGATFYFTMQQKKESATTCQTPEDAYRETHKALSLLSTKVNQGVESINYVEEYEIAKDRVFKN